jgi:twinkle protein
MAALLMNLAQYDGWTHAIYSPENAPTAEHTIKLASKYLGKPYWDGPTQAMSDDELRLFGAWANERFLFLDPEFPTLDTVLGIARGFVFRKGIRGLVLDPWNRMDHSRPGGVTITEHVKTFLAKLSAFKDQTDLHIWLVAHPRIMHKEDGKLPVPTPYDISDSAHFFNMADNCIAVSRDKTDPNGLVGIHVQKVRNKRVGDVGTAFLAYDRVTGRYREA